MKNNIFQMLNEVRHDAIEKSRDAEPRERTFDLIYLMCDTAHITRREGFLAVSEEMEYIRIPNGMAFSCDVRKALDLLCEDDPNYLAEVLTNRYWVKNLQGEDALIYYLMIISVYKILTAGLSPKRLETLLLSCLPDEAAEGYSEYKKSKERD